MFEFECSCEMKKHRAPLEGYEISSGAIEKLPQLLKDYHRVYMVADRNTYRAAGKRVETILKANDMHHQTLILDDEVVLPNAETLGRILLYAHDLNAKSDIFRYSPLPDLILAVGSGTINDSCRLTSYRMGLPYAVVATAPSMDGYASAGTPLLHDGTKSTVQGTTPKYIIGDLDVLKEAPYETPTLPPLTRMASNSCAVSSIKTGNGFFIPMGEQPP